MTSCSIRLGAGLLQPEMRYLVLTVVLVVGYVSRVAAATECDAVGALLQAKGHQVPGKLELQVNGKCRLGAKVSERDIDLRRGVRGVVSRF